ncbi:MAG: hypothetical protein KF912_01825 [Phycisphaeraceae bacterium]|nr:hypothetical protein [Phycisphaeraceae bacterium]MBX3366039.1 hypothetical protein [Phycisphaeraceae bacterium]
MDQAPQNPVSDHAPPLAPSAQSAPLRLHPPTSPGPVEPNEEGRIWPNMIGIGVIVLQGLGLIASIGSAAASLIDLNSLFGVGGMGMGEMIDVAKKWQPYLLACYAIAGVLAVVAIFGGAMLLTRRRLGVHLLIIWSLLRIPYAIFVSWATTGMQRDNLAAMSNAGAIGPQVPGMTSVMVWTSLLMSFVVAMAIPAFLLIWFSVKPIRRQTRLWR